MAFFTWYETLPIYSIGDPEYFSIILNSISAMTSASGITYALFGIGAGVWMLTAGMRNFFESRGVVGIPWQHLLGSLILFLVCFGGKANVVIHDVYNGGIAKEVIANVPFGPAMAGSLISSLGYETTQLFEQGFSRPTMTSGGSFGYANGFAKPFEMFMNLALPQTHTAAMDRSIKSYFSNCKTSGGFDVNVDLGKIYNDITGKALQSISSIFTTKYYSIDSRGDQSVEILTCAEAYQRINSVFNSNEFGKEVGMTLSKKSFQGGLTSTNALYEAENILQGLVRDFGNGAILLAKNTAWWSALGPLATQDIPGAKAAQTVNDRVMGKAENQFLSLRLWSEYVRPTLTFFEAFFYAFSPILAIIMVIVPGILGHYLFLMIWIQTWLPLFAITNQYLFWSFEGFCEVWAKNYSNVSQGMNALSIADTYEFFLESLNHLTMASNFCMMVPTLSFLVLTGSQHAISAVARSSGADAEKAATTPGGGGSSARINQGSLGYAYTGNFDPNHGTVTSSPSGTPKLDISQGIEGMTRQAQQEAQTAEAMQTNAVVGAVTRNQGAMTALGHQIAAGNKSSSGLTNTSGVIENTASSISDIFGLNRRQGQELNKIIRQSMQTSAIGGYGKGGGTGGESGETSGVKGMVNAGMSAAIDYIRRTTNASQESIDEKLEDRYGKNYQDNVSAQFTSALTKDVTDNKNVANTLGFSSEDRESIQKATAKKESLQQKFEKLSATSNKMGLAQSLDYGELNKRFARGDGAAQQALANGKYWQKYGNQQRSDSLPMRVGRERKAVDAFLGMWRGAVSGNGNAQSDLAEFFNQYGQQMDMMSPDFQTIGNTPQNVLGDETRQNLETTATGGVGPISDEAMGWKEKATDQSAGKAVEERINNQSIDKMENLYADRKSLIEDDKRGTKAEHSEKVMDKKVEGIKKRHDDSPGMPEKPSEIIKLAGAVFSPGAGQNNLTQSVLSSGRSESIAKNMDRLSDSNLNQSERYYVAAKQEDEKNYVNQLGGIASKFVGMFGVESDIDLPQTKEMSQAEGNLQKYLAGITGENPEKLNGNEKANAMQSLLDTYSRTGNEEILEEYFQLKEDVLDLENEKAQVPNNDADPLSTLRIGNK